MLRHWIQKSVNDVRRLIEPGRPDPGTQMREFATAVKALAADEMLTREALCQQLSALADAALNRRAPSRASLIRVQLLMSRHRQTRALLRTLRRARGYCNRAARALSSPRLLPAPRGDSHDK